MNIYTIREAKEEDKWNVLNWRNHEDVRNVLLTSDIISKNDHNIWWNKTISSKERMILIFEQNGVGIGMISIYNKKEMSAWWGFFLDNKSLSQREKLTAWIELEEAVINYADEVLCIENLYCESLRSNKLVWQLHERSGFIECDKPLDAADTDKDVIYMKYCFQKKINKKVYFLASYNTDFLVEELRKSKLLYNQFDYEIEKVGYAQYRLDLAEKNFQPGSYLCFVERIEDFFSSIFEYPSEECLKNLDERVNEYLKLLILAEKLGYKVMVSDFAIQKVYPYSTEEKQDNSLINTLVREFNKRIYDLCLESSIELIPYSSLSKNNSFSSTHKYWYIARCPFEKKFLEAYSSVILGCILSIENKNIRAIVLDLDNTLWGGAIGDDGVEGIKLGGDFPGNVYKDLQAFFLELKRRGVILTICSKNTEDVALKAIASHPEMILKLDDFITYRINWNNKSTNIEDIAKELNLGLQSICFIDDNPLERKEVKSAFPELFVPELPNDITTWLSFISQLPEFSFNVINSSDIKRVESYKQRAKINNIKSNFEDKKTFLKSLGMELEIVYVNEFNFDRTHQLFNKTNQFNTTTIRYTKDQLKEISNSAAGYVVHVRYKDIYSGEFEGIAALVLEEIESCLVIKNFVMSCRVMGRDIEKAIIGEIIKFALTKKMLSVVGLFIKTDKNEPVSLLYSNLGFYYDQNRWVLDNITESINSEYSDFINIVKSIKD